MRINSPYITGSAIITGNLCVQGTITGTITGVASTASYAETLDGLDSTQFVQTGSFNSYTSSASSSLGDLSGSVATTTSNLSSSIGSLSGSVATTTSGLSSSIGSLSGSISGSIGSLSSSVATTTSDLSSSIGNISSSVATTTSTLGGRITTIEGRGATTGSNTFVGSQVITGSLYITTDLIVQGSSSLQNITASAVSIGTNTVILNTDTPAVRFAGVSVQDSGSNVGVTGSIFWDGLCNRWVYSNPSGVGYSGGLLISGPRNTGTLGDEVGTTSCALMIGQGGDHITSSAIFHYGNATCIPNTLAGGIGCFSGAVCTLNASVSSCLGVGVSSPQGNFEVVGLSYFTRANNSLLVNPNYGGANTHSQLQVVCNMALAFATCGDNERMRITSDGVVGIGTNAPVIQDGNLVVAGCVGTGQGTANTVAQINIWETTSANKSGLWFGSMTNANTGVIGSRTATGNIAFQTYCGSWAERMRITYNGNVGIGISNPSGLLHINGTGPTFKLTDCSASGNGGDVYLRAEKTGVGYNNLTTVAFSYNFKGGGSETSFLNIGSTGVSCFSSTVCAPVGIFSGNVGIGCTTPGYVLDVRDGTTGSAGGRGMRLSVCSNSAGPQFRLEYQCSGDSRNWLIGTNQEVAGDFIIRNSTIAGCDAGGASSATRFSINKNGFVSIGGTDAGFKLDIQSPGCAGTAENVARIGNIPGTNNGLLVHRCADNSYRYIFQSGIMCVQNTICTGTLIGTTGIILNGTMKTFVAQKNFAERLTNVDFFRVASSVGNGYQVVVYSHSQNGGVGWSQSQIFQAVTAPYWGGWVGTSTNVSTIGSGSPMITSAVVGNDGTITFRVSTGNNGTITDGTINSYIQVTAFSIDNISVTVL
jgi:hypothetical protein